MMTDAPAIHPRKDLLDRVALVTGAASGIGLAITKRLLQEGAKVALWDFNVANLEQAKETLCQFVNEEQIFLVRCDITKEDDVVAAMESTVAHFGELNIAVNNAGVSVSVPSDECTLEQWNWVMNVNCTGSFLVSREAIKVFKKQGHGGVIVFNNSDNSLKPSRHFLAYNASKAAVLHMARTIANEFGSDNIRANSVLPGAVFGGSQMWTQELREARAKIHGFEADTLEEEYKKNNALGVIIDPAEIAEVVVFLASDRSGKMTGNALVIDGGGPGGFVR
ncbi:MAG: SDR family oxidoreductase [Anaerolineaceae bacterium]|jgi:NAD(P)-dependent dehydrogenase (short-subunit alcohol dehydrogenase family)|nr:SDR family oxidoreductase [Anaerolineaceae bacterium]